MTSGTETNRMASALGEYRSPIASFVVLIAGALIFLWISRGTGLHQLAIGILLSLVTLAILLGLFELFWWLALHDATSSDTKHRDGARG
jgi:hypothetical protein